MTNADRWLVARYCGWMIEHEKESKHSGECWIIRIPEAVPRATRNCDGVDVREHRVWFEPDEETIASCLPAFDTDPAQVVTMLEAMADDDCNPWLLPSTREDLGRWFVQTMGRKTVEHYPQATIPEAVFAACLASAKEKYGDQ